MNNKIKCLREKMKLLDIDGMIVTNPVNINYIIGVNAEGTLLLTRKDNIFITDARYIEEVNKTITIYDEIIVDDVANVTENDYLGFFEDCNKIGLEENHITHANYQNFVRKYRLKEAIFKGNEE